jgi:hypothetical protein
MNLRATVKLIFSESAFLKSELDHIEKKRQAGEAYQAAADFAPNARLRIQAKRRNLLKSAVWIISLVLAGALIAATINANFTLSGLWVRVVRAVSIVCLAWAVWSKIGDVETFKGQTLIELTSQYLYKLLYSLGVFLGSLALFLEGHA